MWIVLVLWHMQRSSISSNDFWLVAGGISARLSAEFAWSLNIIHLHISKSLPFFALCSPFYGSWCGLHLSYLKAYALCNLRVYYDLYIRYYAYPFLLQTVVYPFRLRRTCRQGGKEGKRKFPKGPRFQWRMGNSSRLNFDQKEIFLSLCYIFYRKSFLWPTLRS